MSFWKQPATNCSVAVVLDHGGWNNGSADGAIPVEQIHKTRIAFRCAIKLDNALNSKSILESHPDVGSQSVAGHLDQGIVSIIRLFGLGEQIATQLTDVDEAVAGMFAHVVEKMAGRKPAPKKNGCTSM